MNDEMFMERAIALAEKGRMTAPPNPWVGCVIVNNGKIVGEGYHHSPGKPHAEPNALEAAGVQAHGATAYVTLEPCAHHGRTPPCTEALIQAKVARIVIAQQDPDPQVAGKGVALLRKAGIEVTIGVSSDKAKNSLRAYLHHRTTGRPYCTIKAATSIDGKTAAADGSSQWITCPQALADAHQLRAESQAILVGSGTVIADNPSLTVRHVPNPSPPLRVVLDSTGKTPTTAHVLDTAAPTLMITTTQCPPAIIEEWQKTADVEVLPTINLDDVMALLGKRHILQVMVEGGSTLHGALLKADLIHELRLYIGPKILGNTAVPLFKGFSLNSLADSPSLSLMQTQQIGDCVRADWLVNNGKQPRSIR